jgi:hypothetical protein
VLFEVVGSEMDMWREEHRMVMAGEEGSRSGTLEDRQIRYRCVTRGYGLTK